MNFLRLAALHTLTLSALVHAAETPANSTPPPAPAGESAPSARKSIAGTVIDASGKPVAGVTVFVYEGWPKKGDYNYCPTCFPDCGKQGVTDATGAFRLDDLDPTLGFNLISTQKNFCPTLTTVENPGANPVTVKLEKQTGGDTPARRYKGRVLDPDGTPIWGAKIEPIFTSDALDKIVVSEGDGTFVINSRKDITYPMRFKFQTHEFGVFISQLKVGDEVNEVHMLAGAIIKGRLVRDGKPLAGAVVGVIQTDRNIEVYLGRVERQSDENGRFELPHVPAETACQLYAVAKTFAGRGTFAPKAFLSGKNGASLELGDIPVTPGYSVAGKIVLENGKPPKAGTHISLSVNNSSSPYQELTDATGAFRFTDIPAGIVDLHVSLPHYLPAESNISLYRYEGSSENGAMLRGTISNDKNDLVLAYRKDERAYSKLNDHPEQPLAGAESAHPELLPIKVPETIVPRASASAPDDEEERQPKATETTCAGHVLDEEGRAIPHATLLVTKETLEHRRLMTLVGGSAFAGKTFTTDDSGAFLISGITPGHELRIILSAAGYKTIHLAARGTPADLKIKLSRSPASGEVFSGRITDGEHRPVASALVRLTVWQNNGMGQGRVAITDAKGVYHLPRPESPGRPDIEISASGFVPQSIRNFSPAKGSSDFALESSTTVSGRLLSPDGKPVHGGRVHLALKEPGRWFSRADTAVDENGVFHIEGIPGNNVYTLQALTAGYLPETEVKTDAPGTTIDLGDLKLKPGYKLAGRIVMRDGGALPDDLTRLTLSDNDQSNEREISVDKNGYFRTANIPETPVVLSAWPAKVLSSSRNAANAQHNLASLLGTLTGDKTDLIFELERGGLEERKQAAEDAAKLPLRGAESVTTATK